MQRPSREQRIFATFHLKFQRRIVLQIVLKKKCRACFSIGSFAMVITCGMKHKSVEPRNR